MTNTTYLGLYDDFQQAQRVARDLKSNDGISLSDIAIISKRDDPSVYENYLGYFNAREEPEFKMGEDEHERDKDFLRPMGIGFIIGVLPMALLAWLNNTVLFDSPALTLTFMLAFGGAVGAFLGAIMVSMDVFTRVETVRGEMLEDALLEAMTVLAIRDTGNYDGETIMSTMRSHQPVEAVKEDANAWIGNDWPASADKPEEIQNESHDTIADDRYRSFDWAEDTVEAEKEANELEREAI